MRDYYSMLCEIDQEISDQLDWENGYTAQIKAGDYTLRVLFRMDGSMTAWWAKNVDRDSLDRSQYEYLDTEDCEDVVSLARDLKEGVQ